MIKLYAVKDKASNTTANPFSFSNDRDAVDGLRQVAKDEKTSIGKHPEDFDLYFLGDYDPREMKIIPLDQPKLIIGAAELLN